MTIRNSAKFISDPIYGGFVSDFVFASSRFMPRPKFENSISNPYHVGSRCINREWFELPMERVWTIMCDYLFLVKHAFDLQIFSFVLMSNHFHMLVKSPKGNLSDAMGYLKRETGRVLSLETGRTNQIWGGRFHRCEITHNHHYFNVYKYIFRNPVAKNLCEKVEEYPYSTLNGTLGFGKLFIPTEADATLFWSVEETLEWLNRPTSQENLDAIRTALRYQTFQLPKVDSRPHPLELDLL